MKAIIFDVFGTLLKIDRSLDPFTRLVRMAIAQGLSVPRTASHDFMSHPWGWRQCAEHVGLRLDATASKSMDKMLERHIASIKCFPEVGQVLNGLHERNIKIAVCSNLAQPYGEAVRRLLPNLDAYTLSFEVGKTKPDPEIYLNCLSALGAEARSTCMIGDSPRCDVRGPESVGITGYWLNRDGSSNDGFNSLLDAISILQHA